MWGFSQTIEYEGCDIETYQQDVVIHRSSGENNVETRVNDGTTWNVYVGEHCQTTYDDIRFLDAGGNNVPYHLFPGFDADKATFRIRIENATDDGTIKVLYGNENVSTTSAPNDTYLHFSAFDEDELVDPWFEGEEEGTITVQNGILSIENNYVAFWGWPYEPSLTNVRFEIRWKIPLDYYIDFGPSNHRFIFNEPTEDPQSEYDSWALGWDDDEYHTLTFKEPYPEVGDWVTFWINFDESSSHAGWDSNYIITNPNDPPIYEWTIIHHPGSSPLLVDHFLIRSFTNSPPLVIEFGEETSGRIIELKKSFIEGRSYSQAINTVIERGLSGTIFELIFTEGILNRILSLKSTIKSSSNVLGIHGDYPEGSVFLGSSVGCLSSVSVLGTIKVTKTIRTLIKLQSITDCKILIRSSLKGTIWGTSRCIVPYFDAKKVFEGIMKSSLDVKDVVLSLFGKRVYRGFEITQIDDIRKYIFYRGERKRLRFGLKKVGDTAIRISNIHGVIKSIDRKKIIHEIQGYLRDEILYLDIDSGIPELESYSEVFVDLVIYVESTSEILINVGRVIIID